MAKEEVNYDHVAIGAPIHPKSSVLRSIQRISDLPNYDNKILVEVVGSFKKHRRATKKTTTIVVGRGLSTSKGLSLKGSSGGLIGLENLGNTCFMNSAIQCLVHTPQFAKYIQGDYHKKINKTNASAKMGELALAFSELLRKLLALGQNPVAPRSFKEKLAKFASQFSGNNQHDS